MSRVFLSHASADNREAIALKRWLVEQRPELAKEIFLDIDPDSGLQVGARWKSQLFASTSRCEAVICLLSASWESSHECKTEYRTAEGLGKQILVARLEDTGDSDITADWQRCDLFASGPTTSIELPDGAAVSFNTAALHQLRNAIEGSGVAPTNFRWPPQDEPRRAPYRGWDPFTDLDAGVFFGRDAAIVRGLDALRAMRFRLLATLSGQKTVFVVLGPSGSGKSSFMRAGLIPRLEREDRRFVVLGVVRPENAALTGKQGLAAAIQAGRDAVGLSGPPLGDLKATLGDSERVCQLLAETRAAAAKRVQAAGPAPVAGAFGADDGAPTLVLPVDQAEELFSATAGAEGERLLALLAELLARLNAEDIGLIVAATIRTDRFEEMQNHPSFDQVGTVLFDDLKAMPPSQFEKVITGPAERATGAGQRLTIADELVARLLADAAVGADTLPLLALTLAQLYQDYGSTGQLTLANYEAMGGMRSVVQSTVDKVLANDPDQRAAQLQSLRAAFIPWLATVNPDNDQPLRRVARYRDLPVDSRPLIDALVQKRLLVRDTRDGDATIEVALESLLRQWDELAGWLRAERQNLQTADDIDRNAAGWAGRDHDPAWLLAGTRLTDAESLANTPNFAARLADARDYLAASRDAENQRLAVEERQRQAELRHAQERQRTAETHAGAMRRRARILLAVAVIAVVAAVTAVVGIVQSIAAINQAKANARQSVALRLVSDAADLLAGHRGGGDIRAFQELLAAHALAGSTADAGMLDAVIARMTTAKITDVGMEVLGVAISPDGRRIAAAGGLGNQAVKVFDTDTGKLVFPELDGHAGAVTSVAFSRDGHRLASGSADRAVRLWDADTGKPLGAPLTGHTGEVTGVAFSPDGRRLVSASADETVRRWNADTGDPEGAPLSGHGAPVRSVAFSPDGRRIASGGDDQAVRLWSSDTGQPLGEPLTGHPAGVMSVAFDPGGHRLVVASGEQVWIWNLDSGQPTTPPLTGHTGPVNSVAFSPDGHRVTSASYDDTVRLWDADTGAPAALPFTGHTGDVNGVVFTPDGHRLISGSDDDTVRMWDIDAGAPLTGLTGPANVAYSHDGRVLAASGGNTVQLWNADTGRRRATATSDQRVGDVAVSPDGHRLAVGSADGPIWLWNLDTNQLIDKPLKGHTDSVEGLAFSPDGHRLASASRDSTLRIWNVDTGQQIGALRGHTSWVTSVAYSPDGHRLVSGSWDQTVRLWNADNGQPITALYGHLMSVNDVAFSPDGRRVASAGDDNTARIWNPDTGATVAVLDHPKMVNGVAFAPDGRRLATTGDDNALRLWSWEADAAQPFGAPIYPETSGSDQRGLVGLAFSPNGQRLAVGGFDGSIHLWPAVATTGMLCAKLTANMSGRQWREWVGGNIGYQQQCPGLPTPPDKPRAAAGQTLLPFTGLNSPHAITVDHVGGLYVADTGNNRVLKLAAGATSATVLPFSGLNRPDGVAVDTAGAVYVADPGNNRILKLAAGSSQPTTLLTGFGRPSDVAVDAGGNVYVADETNRRVLKLAAGSTTPITLRLTGSGTPSALGVDDTKHTVYVVMADTPGTGKVLTVPPVGGTNAELPFPGINPACAAVDHSGNLFVTDYDNGSVFELPPAGRAPIELKTDGLDKPSALAVDGSGDLFVADSGNNRILRIQVANPS